MKLSLHTIRINFKSIVFILKEIKKKFLHFERKLNQYRHGLTAAVYVVFVIFLILALLKHRLFIKKLNNLIYGDENVRIDWHDWNFMLEEELRTGLGEHGEPAYWWPYPPSSKQINDTHGYNGYLSDKIALNRSLKDLRPKEYVQIIYDTKLKHK